jgi:type IV pilus assembly protein PilV
MLVLAVGMLGIAAMQMRGLQYNHDAYLRSQISVLAYDIADRMRLNRDSAATFEGDFTIPTTAPTGCATGGATAANDLACWRLQVYNALPPGGTANITNDGGGEYTVLLGWVDRDNNAHSVDYTFVP